jgi:methionyl aminopeptidase
MIHYKTEEEIKIMSEGGKKLKQIFEKLIKFVKPGITTLAIENEAQRLIKEEKAEVSFDKVEGYQFATCLPVNEQIVHTPPSERVLKKGDLLTIDIGLYYQGFHTDCAKTMVVGEEEKGEIKRFLDTGREALKKAIEKIKVGGYLGEVSKAIETIIKKNGYFVIKRLTGHGIGKDLHEDPFVFGFLDRPVEKTLKIKPGLVLAIEVIYSMGTEEMAFEKDNDWSIVTKDGSLSSCFEKTVAVTKNGVLILT